MSRPYVPLGIKRIGEGDSMVEILTCTNSLLIDSWLLHGMGQNLINMQKVPHL